ncbi:MAG: GAF domain-containing protein, partial [Acidobacteriota bacterium]
MSTSNIQDVIGSEISSTFVPLNLSGAANLAASLHGSLWLADILRGCRNFLQEHFPTDRLTLVQHRSNESTATIYSTDDNPEATLVGPRIIVMEPSRLRQCIAERGLMVVPITGDSDPDPVEQRYLVRPETSIVVYVPLILKGKLKGILVLGLPAGAAVEATRRALLAYVAGHLALAIENSDHYYLECRRSRQLEMVSEISRRAVCVEDLAAFLQEAAQLIRTCFDYDLVQIWTTGSTHEDLRIRSSARKSDCAQGSDETPPSMVNECRRRNHTMCHDGLSGQTGLPAEKQPSRLAVPIRIRGKFLGVLYLESSRIDAFPAEDLSTMEGVASLIASTYENLWAFEHA